MGPTDQPSPQPEFAGASARSPQPVHAQPVHAQPVHAPGESAMTRPPLPYRVILEQSGGTLRKALMTMLFLALGISVMFNFGLVGQYHSYLQTDPNINERLHSGSATAKDKIAVIAVRGAIMESDGFVKRQIDRVREDDDVKAIVLRVDSPGGTVTASHYIYHHLKKLQKEKKIPMVVSMGSIAASGGYYVSMAVGDEKDTIFAEETTWTGSIGVIIPSYDFSGLLEKWDIRDRSFASGQLKQMGSPTQQLEPEEREAEEAKLQQLVDESFQGFKDVVAYGRPQLAKDTMAMKEVVTGQIFTAKQAHRLGLVDQLGYIEDAIERAAELAKLDAKNVRVIEFEQPEGLLDRALGGRAQAGSFDVATLIDLTAPRAYYLSSWLPAVVANRR